MSASPVVSRFMQVEDEGMEYGQSCATSVTFVSNFDDDGQARGYWNVATGRAWGILIETAKKIHFSDRSTLNEVGFRLNS